MTAVPHISEAAPLDRPLVLVVENDPEWNQFITTALAPEYRTAVAFDGADGLEKAATLQPDLILTAVLLPKMSGDHFVRAVRARTEFDTVPIIVLTVNADYDLRVALLRAGVQDYLLKPIAPEELCARVGNLIAIRRARTLLQDELESQGHDIAALADEVVARKQELQTTIEALRARERRLALQHALSGNLAECPTLREAAPRILQTLCENLGWPAGGLWWVDRNGNVLRCLGVWGSDAPAPLSDFAADSQRRTFARGLGLPGRVWATGDSQWIADVVADENFHRAAMALESGLRSACGFPIMVGGQVVGVVEFFSRDTRQPDGDVLETLATVGGQIGQFIERTRAEDALRGSDERLRLALQAAQMGTWEWDIGAGRVTWSTTLEAIHGLIPGAFPGTFDAYLSDIHPDDCGFVERSIRESLDGGSDHDIEYRIVWPDGSIHWVEGRGSVVRNHAGLAIRMTGVCMDITERKRGEEERARLLEREQSLRLEAETANQAKDEFLATLSHELRTPLSAILVWAGLLRTSKLDATATDRALETIERNAKLQAQLIEDLLDVSRITTGKLNLDVRPTYLAPILQTAIDAVRPAAEAKGVHISVMLDPWVEPVWGDANRLQQIVWNLLSNAVKFTPKGGRVEIQLAQVDSRAQIRVTDTGKGISPDFLPYVFDRFRQADSRSTRAHGGLGLGLAIVRHLVELHGGTVRAESTGEGRGATFIVELPLPALRGVSAGAAPGDTAATPASTLEGVRVLLVDDEADAREFLGVVLTQYGAEVTAAASVPEALEALERVRPTVLISDIGMPGEDGYALIRKVREWEARRGQRVPAAALTAYARSEDRNRALRAGYQMHVPKPVQPTELVAVVAKLRNGVA